MWLQYGMALEANGQPEAALDAISQAVENRRKNRPGTRYLAQMLEDQALVLTELGQYGKAEQALQEAALIRKAVGQKFDHNYLVPAIRLASAFGNTAQTADLAEHNYGPVPQTVHVTLDQLRNLEARAEIALGQQDAGKAVDFTARSLDAIAASPARNYLRNQQARALLDQGRGIPARRRRCPRAAGSGSGGPDLQRDRGSRQP